MPRRLTPYIFAGLLGVVSGIYIFRPLFGKNSGTHMREIHGLSGTAKYAERPQLNTAPKESK